MEVNQEPAQLQPAAFSDNEGREWELELNYAVLGVVKRELKVDLGNVQELGRTWAELLCDDDKCLEVLWLVIAGTAPTGEPAEAVRVGDEKPTKFEWLSALDGDVLEDARRALRAAIENFTPPSKRNLLRRGMGAVDKAWLITIGQAEQRVTKETEAAIGRATGQIARGTRAPKSRASSAGSTTAGASAKRTRR